MDFTRPNVNRLARQTHCSAAARPKAGRSEKKSLETKLVSRLFALHIYVREGIRKTRRGPAP